MDTFKTSTDITFHMASDTTPNENEIDRFTGPDLLPVFIESGEELTFILLPRFDTGRI
jgi:hypothetical protein